MIIKLRRVSSSYKTKGGGYYIYNKKKILNFISFMYVRRCWKVLLSLFKIKSIIFNINFVFYMLLIIY